MYKKNIILLLVFFPCALRGEFRPLNILFVVGFFPVPSQIFILNLMTGLIDRGHNISIHAYNRGSLDNAHSDIEKYQLLSKTSYGEKLRKNAPCDIVFCQFGYSGKKIFEMKQLTGWLQGKKVVTCFRGADITSRVQKERDMYKTLFQKGDLFLPVCKYFVPKLIEAGCSPHKIVVHHSAINCSQFFFKRREKPVNNAINIVSVCRLVEKKGIDDAIIACAKVVKKYPRIHYTIFGDGPEYNHLEQLINVLQMEKNITLAGWAMQEEVVQALDKAHIFILASKTSADGNEEGIPNALKEAMAKGVIVIGTPHAGNPELIEDGVSGFLVPEKNSLELAKKIQYVIEHPEKWQAICYAARKKIEDEFEIGKTVEQLEQLFYKLLGKRTF